MYRRDRSVPLLASTIPKLESNSIARNHSINKHEIVADSSCNILGEIFASEHSNDRGFTHSTASDKADLDKFIDNSGIFFDNLKKRVIDFGIFGRGERLATVGTFLKFVDA